MDHATVSTQLALSLLSSEGDDLPIVAELRYSAHDPLAVEALFDDGTPDPVRWVFARDLLAAGLDRRTGDGDVVSWPTQDAQAHPAVHLRLRSPNGDALLEAPADAALESLLGES